MLPAGRREALVELTAGEVGLAAAAIALLSPLIVYRTTASLDRERWLRQQRSSLYIDLLAAYGQMASRAHAGQSGTWRLPTEDWRALQARFEAFSSDDVFAMREPYLRARDEYEAADSVAARGAAANRLTDLFEDLRRQIRREMRTQLGRAVRD